MWPTSLIDDDELGDKKMKEEADGFYGVDMTDCQLFDFNDDLFLRNDESGVRPFSRPFSCWPLVGETGDSCNTGWL